MGDDDSDDSSPAFDTVDLLELAREEGRRTIDRQIQTFDDIDDKAARTLRLNLIVLSILLTGFSVVTSGDGFPNSVVTGELPNRFIYLGILSILLSTILAAFVYTGSNYRSGMSGRDLQRRILNDDIRPIDALYDTVDGYARWAPAQLLGQYEARSALDGDAPVFDIRIGVDHGGRVRCVRHGRRADRIRSNPPRPLCGDVAIGVLSSSAQIPAVSAARTGRTLIRESELASIDHMSDTESVNEKLADLRARSRDREGLEGQIVFKGDYASSDDE